MRLLMKPEPEARSPERDARPLLIFITCTGIGDFLMALPLLGVLRSRFRALPLIPSMYGDLAQLLQQDSLLEGYLLASGSLIFYRNPFGHLVTCRKLSRLRPDVVAIYSKLAMGYGARLGLLRAGRVLYCHPRGVTPRASGSLEVLPSTGNQSRDYLQFAEQLGVPAAAARVRLTDDVKEHLDRAARALITWPSYAVVAPWTSDPRREAPLQFFRDCIEIIVTEGRLPVVVTGLPSHRSAASDMLRGFSDRFTTNLVGRTTLRHMLGILSGARFVLTNDGGTLHMARLAGTPIIAAFGPTAPEQRIDAHSEGLVTLHLGLSCSPCAHTPFHYRCPGAYLQCLQGLEASAAREPILAACQALAHRML